MKAFSFFAPRYAALRLTLLAMLFSLWGGAAWAACPTGPFTLTANKTPAAYCDGEAITLTVDFGSTPANDLLLEVYDGVNLIATLPYTFPIANPLNLPSFTASVTPFPAYLYSVKIYDAGGTPPYPLCGTTNTIYLIVGEIQAGTATPFNNLTPCTDGGIFMSGYSTLCPDVSGLPEPITLQLLDNTFSPVGAPLVQTPPATTTNFGPGLCAGTYYVRITDPCGCDETYGPFTVLRTENGRNTKIENAFVYPNPAQDIVNLRYAAGELTRYRIIGPDGRTRHEGKLTPDEKEHTLNLQDQAPGAYMLQIVEGEELRAVRSFILNP